MFKAARATFIIHKSIIESWKNGGLNTRGTLLTDFSKIFDYLSTSWTFISKLHAYGFDLPSTQLIPLYLRNRKYRVKINNGKIVHSLKFYLKSLILGPLSINTFHCDLFYFAQNFDITNCDDDNTCYSTRTKIMEVF